MQPDPVALKALARRVEAGESGRALDGQIMFSLFAKPVGSRAYLWPEDDPSWSFALRTTESSVPFRKGQETVEWECDDGSWILMNSLRVPRLTTSLDAIEALRERLLPSSVLSVFSWNDGFGARLLRPGGDRKAVHVFAPTETATRLAALLYAVAAKVEGERADA